MPLPYLFSFLLLLSPYHGLYISLQEIRYEARAETLSVGYRIFTDDLEAGLRHYHGRSIRVLDRWEDAEVQKAVAAYLTHKTQIIWQGKEVTLTCTGLTQQQDATWATFTATVEPSAHPTVVVHNALLVDLFPTQTNLLRVYFDDSMEMKRLDQRTVEETFQG